MLHPRRLEWLILDTWRWLLRAAELDHCTYAHSNTVPLTFNGSHWGIVNLIKGSGGSTTEPADLFPFFHPPSLLLIDPSRIPPYFLSAPPYPTCRWSFHFFPSSVFSSPVLLSFTRREWIVPPISDFVYSSLLSLTLTLARCCFWSRVIWSRIWARWSSRFCCSEAIIRSLSVFALIKEL